MDNGMETVFLFQTCVGLRVYAQKEWKITETTAFWAKIIQDPFLIPSYPDHLPCKPKLSEPGAVEQGERAEAGRRGSSGAQSRPGQSSQSHRQLCRPGRPLASNLSGRP